VVVQGLSYGEAARRYGVSKGLVFKLHHRFLAEGEAAYESRSRRPATSPNRTPEAVRARVLALREQLTAAGMDAGADTILAHLERESIHLGRTTVWRILTGAGKVAPEPRKRPRSSWTRFSAERPNEMWQSDFTHWVLPDGHEVEIIAWLDDHSRYLTHLGWHRRVTGRTVTDTFTAAAGVHGFPAATLTDNGMVYTTRYSGRADGGGNQNAFEALLALEGITQKNGKPYKPTTQGKIERFWQTLKKHLSAAGLDHADQLQDTLDAFRDYHDTCRPHRALRRRTPEFAYTLIPKAAPTRPEDPDTWRVRYDTVDDHGKVSLRLGNKMAHLACGRAHSRTPVIVLIHGLDATTITHDGEVIAEHRLDPDKSYQPKK
jgi:transposase InsO family protein